VNIGWDDHGSSVLTHAKQQAIIWVFTFTRYMQGLFSASPNILLLSVNESKIFTFFIKAEVAINGYAPQFPPKAL